MISRDEFSGILDQMCPMYVILDVTGHIQKVGPILQKLRPDVPLQGRRFLEVFDLSRPRQVSNMEELLARSGAKLHLKFRDEPQTGLKGIIMPFEGGKGALINLSFGISILDAVRDYDLTSADFSATDLAIELLYLVEAKSAAMDASRKLNLRLQGAMIAAEEQAYTDTLTGLKNRRAMDFVLGRMVASGSKFSLMHLDLDYFKEVNDTHGHAAGDHVLKEVARAMRRETRDTDTIARVGGDEFVLIFEGVTDRTRLIRIATRLIDRIREPMQFQDTVCRVSASVGIAMSTQSVPTEAVRMLHMADVALYEAKHKGRSTYEIFMPELELRERRVTKTRRASDASTDAVPSTMEQLIEGNLPSEGKVAGSGVDQARSEVGTQGLDNA